LAAAGIFYFSDAQNSGSVLKGNGGTWKATSWTAARPWGRSPEQRTTSAPPRLWCLRPAHDSLSFSTTGGFNGEYELKWSDPLGASFNDYDLFILDAGLTTVLASSTRIQSGSQNPEEYIPPVRTYRPAAASSSSSTPPPRCARYIWIPSGECWPSALGRDFRP